MNKYEKFKVLTDELNAMRPNINTMKWQQFCIEELEVMEKQQIYETYKDIWDFIGCKIKGRDEDDDDDDWDDDEEAHQLDDEDLDEEPVVEETNDSHADKD